jgi:hypothetical protein
MYDCNGRLFRRLQQFSMAPDGLCIRLNEQMIVISGKRDRRNVK